MTTYTKLKSGEWGLRVTGHAVAGQTVSVTTKAGAVKRETVGKVLWTGNGVSLCTIAGARGSGYRPEPRGDGGPRGHKPCYMCGSYYCEGARGGLCQDD